MAGLCLGGKGVTSIVDDAVVKDPLCVVSELPRGLVFASSHFLHNKMIT